MLPFDGRREDGRLIQGQGRYTADWSMPGQLYARFVRADRAHATIRSVDKTAAGRSPGVIAILDGNDVSSLRTLPPGVPYPGRFGARILVPERPALARVRVRHVGEEVAVVIAETAQQAADAAELVTVDYDDLPAISGLDAALVPGAAQLHDNIPGNICFDFDYGDAPATEAAIASAAHVVTLTADSPRVAPVPMEPRAVLAWFTEQTGHYEIRCSHQGGGTMAAGLAVMLGVERSQVRVNRVDVGGAFGPRGAPYAEYAVLLHAARKLGRPISWVSTRSEEFLTDSHGRGIRLTGELALDADGRFLALRTLWLCDEGAYLTAAGALTNTINGQLIAAGPYRTPVMYGRHKLVMTNATPTNAYRGAGRPEAVYLIERLVDEAAAQLGIDPIELRRRNAIPRDAMPYRTPIGHDFDSGDFPALVSRAEQESAWASFPSRRAASASNGKLRGIGCALFLEPSGAGSAPIDQGAIRFNPDGSAHLYVTSQSSGQGHETVFPQLVASILGLDPEAITLRASDPDGPAIAGSGAFGSRSGMIQGSALLTAADEVVQKGLRLAGVALEANEADIEFKDGSYRVKGTDLAITLADLITREATATGPHPLDATADQPIFRAFPSGAHVAEVEIDRETGAVELLSYTAVDDIGTVISHVLAEGQLRGGIVQGLGQVFGEACHYDASGQLLTGSFMDYVMPRADRVGPEPVVIDQGVQSPTNRIGAKGVGESGTIGAAPTLMNAILDALRHAGVRRFDMPATPRRVWEALQTAT